jgi:hypothetical protein
VLNAPPCPPPMNQMSTPATVRIRFLRSRGDQQCWRPEGCLCGPGHTPRGLQAGGTNPGGPGRDAVNFARIITSPNHHILFKEPSTFDRYRGSQ